MPRSRIPVDSGSRERLLQAGSTLASRSGIRALTVRAVAAEAGANLGSFVYHFGSRERFVDELIERWYAPLFDQLSLLAETPADALAGLRAAVLRLVHWLVEHRDFVVHLMLDAGAGEAGAQRFLRSLDRRHPALLLSLITQAQQAGQLRSGDPMQQMLFLMSTLAAPVLLLHLLGQRELAPPELVKTMAAFSTDPAAIEVRLDWALHGLVPEWRGGAR